MAMIVHDSSGQIYYESESDQIFSSNICHLKYLELEKMRGEVHILVYCPIDTLQWGLTHSAVGEDVCSSEVSSQRMDLKQPG